MINNYKKIKLVSIYPFRRCFRIKIGISKQSKGKWSIVNSSKVNQTENMVRVTLDIHRNRWDEVKKELRINDE